MAHGTFKFNFGSASAEVELDGREVLVQKQAEYIQFDSLSQVHLGIRNLMVLGF
jgi:hypothetical protein